MQAASEAWCTPPLPLENAAEAPVAEIQEIISKEEADSLLQRVEAAEQVQNLRKQQLLYELDIHFFAEQCKADMQNILPAVATCTT